MYPRPNPQPAKAALVLANVTIADAARTIGVSPHWLGRVLNGYTPPSERVQRGLTELTGKPADELFPHLAVAVAS